jgi:hypothetical protein
VPPVQRGSAGAAVASTGNVANPTNLTPPLPAHQAGDVLLCYTACRATAPTVATPAEWTQLLNVVGTVGHLALFGKVAASASETAPTVTWSGLTTGTGGTPVQAQCAAFTETQLATDVLGTVENRAASTTAAASGTAITTLTADDLVLALGFRPDDVGTWSAPAGLTLIGAALTTSGADMAFGWAYQVKAAPGSSAPADFGVAGGTSQASTGIQIALKAPQPTQTSAAEISLATAPVPETRTQHKLVVRARKTNAAHAGTLRLRLYEGATARSAELETGALTTAFADYTLSVADADAAAITDYSNLSVRLYGYSVGGTATVFEVSQLYLEAPESVGIPVSASAGFSFEAGGYVSGPAAMPLEAHGSVSDSAATPLESLVGGTVGSAVLVVEGGVSAVASASAPLDTLHGPRATGVQPLESGGYATGNRVLPVEAMALVPVAQSAALPVESLAAAIAAAASLPAETARPTSGSAVAPIESALALARGVVLPAESGAWLALTVQVPLESGLLLPTATSVPLEVLVPASAAAEMFTESEVGAWTPNSIPGLAIWFDASQLGLAPGEPVSPWPNLANPAVPGTIVGTPAPSMAYTTQNGLPVVFFLEQQGRVRMTGTGVDRDFTLAYVARQRGPVPGRIVCASYPPPNFLLGWWTTYEDIGYSSTGGFFVPDTRKAWTTDWKLYSGDGSTPNYRPRLFSDGVLLSSGGLGSGESSTGDGFGGTFNISGYDAGGTNETCDCEVAEVVLYDRKLSDAERQQVEGYLRDKWFPVAVPVASSAGLVLELLNAARATVAKPVEAQALLAATGVTNVESIGFAFAQAALAVETGATLGRQGTFAAESLAAVAISKGVPVESLGLLARLLALPVEAMALGATSAWAILPVETHWQVNSAGVLHVEALRVLAAEAQVPLETILPLARSMSLPAETAALLRMAAVTQAESLLALTDSGALSVETVQALAANKIVPVEAIRSISAPISLPVEVMALGFTSAFTVLPVETFWRMTGSALLPVETHMPLVQAAQVPVESAASLVKSALTPLEALRATITSAATQIDSSGFLSVARIFPAETFAPVAVGMGLPVETQRAVTVSLSAPLEGLLALSTSTVQPLDVSIMQSVLADLFAESHVPVSEQAVLPTETMRPATTMTAALVMEALADVAVEAEQPLEAIADVNAVAVLSYEAIGGGYVFSFATLPVETVEGMAAIAQLPLDMFLRVLLVPPFGVVVVSRRTAVQMAERVAEVLVARHREDVQVILREDAVKPDKRKLELVT